MMNTGSSQKCSRGGAYHCVAAGARQGNGRPGRARMVSAVPDEDDVTLGNVLLGVSGEEEVAAPCCLHDLVETRLVDGQLLQYNVGYIHFAYCKT